LLNEKKAQLYTPLQASWGDFKMVTTSFAHYLFFLPKGFASHSNTFHRPQQVQTTTQFFGYKTANSVGFATKISLFLSFFLEGKSKRRVK